MAEDPEKKFKKQLTWEEIKNEISKVRDFFEQIPTELKANAAECFIFEAALWGSLNFYEAIGIFEESKSRYREISIQVQEREEREEKEEREDNGENKNEVS